MKKILMVVDYQTDFVAQDGALPVPNADTIADNIQSRIDSDDYIARVYTFDTHTKNDYDGSDEQKLFPNIHCEFGTDGWNFYKIKPKYENWDKFIESRKVPFDTFATNNEFFFTKDVFDIWEGNSNYANWFTNTFSKDEYEIDVVGVATEFCVKMNIQGLTDRGYKVNLIQDCVAGITEEGISEAMEIFKETSVNFK